MSTQFFDYFYGNSFGWDNYTGHEVVTEKKATRKAKTANRPNANTFNCKSYHNKKVDKNPGV